MNTVAAKTLGREILSPLHYASLEDAGVEMLFLSASAKLSQYRQEDARFREKYGEPFDSFRKKVEAKVGEEDFGEEDDLMEWQYAYEAATLWEQKVREIEKCF